MQGTLYLIPTTLGITEVDLIPPYVSNILQDINEFIVEDEKSARRYLIKAGINKPIAEIVFHLLNEHTNSEGIVSYLDSIEKGKNIGVLSEAGVPCVADPGAAIVKHAHRKNIKVIPLVGPSSIILALMASGFNGQNFTFHGYLPKDRKERVRKLKELEKTALQKNQTQIFIEAPYRNQHLLEDILNTCDAQTQLCIACDITLQSEFIQSRSIWEWKKKVPEINKRPAVFLICSQ